MTNDPTESELPRVLVVSHNPFSDSQNNGKTLQAFFEDWPRERLAQVYLTLDEPSFDNCDAFYRVTDLDVLKDALPTRTGAAGPVHARDWQGSDAGVKRDLHTRPGYRLIRRIFLARPPAALLARSFVWRHARADRDRFMAWVDAFEPEAVFFQSSNATFAFDLVEDVCRERDIPLVMETTDDYVTPGRWSPLSRRYYRQMQRSYHRAVERAYAVVAIGQTMAEEYAARFGGRWEVAMNSVEPGTPTSPAAIEPGRRIVVHYAGNLGLNRWRMLLSLGEALRLLAHRGWPDTMLEIYTINTPEPDVMAHFDANPRIGFRGSVKSEELVEIRDASDVLVHVESFDAHNRHITRLSISTKIPEYLSADRPVLAIGPADVASIRYLQDEDAAQVVTVDDPEAIATGLLALLDDPERQGALRQRGDALVHTRHSRTQAKQLIAELMRAAVAARRAGRE